MASKLIRNFWDGEFTEGGSGRRFPVLNPATGQAFAEACEADKADVDAAVNSAVRALAGEWSRTTPTERQALLNRIADGIERRLEEFVAAEVEDTGKPVNLARRIEIPRAAAQFRVAAAEAMGCLDRLVATETVLPDGRRAINHTRVEPRGVIAVICPWNFPLMMATWKIAPALMYGNTVIVKPSEETPYSMQLLCEVMQEAGVPAGVFNVLNGFGADSAGAFLTSHRDVDGVTFTGESATGEHIMRSAATGLREVSMECGGKNAALVLADADLNSIITPLGMSVFHNTGQVCLGNERIYVHRSLYQPLLQALKARAEAYQPGDPRDPATMLGPSISREQAEKVLRYYELAKASGATVVHGGGVPRMPEPFAGGSWVEPTIFTGLPEDHPIVREEVFGPVCHVQPFDDVEEAIRMANDNDYGLTASVFSSDEKLADEIAGRLTAATVWINDWMVRDLRVPFGGFARSGVGVEGGPYSLHFYARVKNVCTRIVSAA